MNRTQKSVEDSYLIAYSQRSGSHTIQEDHISVFQSEFIAIADGVSVIPHGDVASRVAAETALWCFKHVRQRPFYWDDKFKLLKRIFRTTNLTLWQKRKESEYASGLASTLCILMLSNRKMWFGSVGDSRVFFVREGLIEELVSPEEQSNMRVNMALGHSRKGVLPRVKSETLLSGDMVFAATDGVADVILEEDIRFAGDIAGDTHESCMKSVLFLLDKAQERGGSGDMTMCVIKKR